MFRWKFPIFCTVQWMFQNSIAYCGNKAEKVEEQKEQYKFNNARAHRSKNARQSCQVSSVKCKALSDKG